MTGTGPFERRERTIYIEVNDAGDPWTPMGLVDPGRLSEEGISSIERVVERVLGEQLERLARARP